MNGRSFRKLASGAFCFAAFAAQAAFASEGMEEIALGGVEPAEHKSAGLPQLDATTFPSQLFWLALTFAILYLYFSRKALPDISGVIENRRAHIDGDIGTADRIRKEAEAAQAAYEKLMGDARAGATKLMHDAEAGVRAKAEKELAALRDKAAKDMEVLEKRLTGEKKAIMAEMDNIAADIASRAAEKIVGIKPDLKQAQTVVQSLNRREAA